VSLFVRLLVFFVFHTENFKIVKTVKLEYTFSSIVRKFLKCSGPQNSIESDRYFKILIKRSPSADGKLIVAKISQLCKIFFFFFFQKISYIN